MPQFVIAYDICDDKRRERVARLLLRRGERIQKSVFVAYLDSEQHQELRRELGALMRSKDLLEFFPVDARLASVHVAWMDEPCSIDPVLVLP